LNNDDQLVLKIEQQRLNLFKVQMPRSATMATSDYSDQAPGSLVPTNAWERRERQGKAEQVQVKGMAFVPAPLPPELDRFTFSGRLSEELLAASMSLGRLDGIAQTLSNPHLLFRPFRLREAKLSSQIENTIASAEEVALVEAGKSSSRAEAIEVHNYINALEHGLNSALPLCNRLICEMHKILMEGVRGQEQQPGQFRSVQNYIGRDGDGLRSARFVPPPPGEVLDGGMRDLERFLNDRKHGFPPLAAIAMAHYQFEAIHPFRDGNGRIGRLIVAMSFCKGPNALLTRPLVYVSAFFERHRQEYYDRLLRVSTHGDWEAWVRFFLLAVANQADDAMQRAQRLLELRAEFIRQVTEPKASSLLPNLVDHLFDWPAVSTRMVASHLNIQVQAAQRHIDRLAEKGILEEVTGATYGRIWVARRPLLSCGSRLCSDGCRQFNEDR
jgi:Fic family protein